eukprot:scaffold8108_cov267-Pinguiococcus_pyrenoidosus.AAC.10
MQKPSTRKFLWKVLESCFPEDIRNPDSPSEAQEVSEETPRETVEVESKFILHPQEMADGGIESAAKAKGYQFEKSFLHHFWDVYYDRITEQGGTSTLGRLPNKRDAQGNAA